MIVVGIYPGTVVVKRTVCDDVGDRGCSRAAFYDFREGRREKFTSVTRHRRDVQRFFNVVGDCEIVESDVLRFSMKRES